MKIKKNKKRKIKKESIPDFVKRAFEQNKKVFIKLANE